MLVIRNSSWLDRRLCICWLFGKNWGSLTKTWRKHHRFCSTCPFSVYL